jgi:mRNA-degrading endonuclease toxin of MazEF toxin-antitoxin module
VHRGELWTYVPQGSPRQPVVVIVSSDGINQSPRAWLLGAPLADGDPGDILAVPVDGHGWVSAGNLSRYYRGWLREHVGTLEQQAMDDLDSALRAALDL